MRNLGMLCLLLLGAMWGGEAKAWQSCQDVMVGMRGNQPIYQQQCQWLAGSVSFDPATRKFGSYWNYADGNEAKAVAQRDCGPNCIAVSFFDDYFYVAATDDDAVGYASTMKEAVSKCIGVSRGQACDIVLAAGSGGPAQYWYFNALSYDRATQKAYTTVGDVRRGAAREAGLKACGNGSDCFTWVFQGAHAAMAMAENDELYADRGDSAAQAKRNALKACKAAAVNKKQCAIVAEAKAQLPDIPAIPEKLSEDMLKMLEGVFKGD